MQGKDDSLLAQLKRIYHQLALMIDLRLQSIRQTPTAAPVNITAAMLKHVRVISSQAQQQVELGHEEPVQIPHNSSFSSDSRQHETIINASGHVQDNQLSEHLKAAERELSHLHLAENLEKRAWEHAHSALRFARRGEEHNAALHVRIAGDSLDEIRHFIDEEKYQQLVESIENYFLQH